MKVDVEDLEKKLIDVFIGLRKSELDSLINALENLKAGKDHFHFRSIGDTKKGIYDIEFYCLEEDDAADNMKIDDSRIIEPNR